MQHASAEAHTQEYAAPVARRRKQSGRVVPFRPRASSLAYTWIAAHGFGPVTTRTLQAIADRSRYATDADKRDLVKAGEIFTFARAACIARDLGTTDRSIRRAVRKAREAGLMVVRKGHRAAVSYVWAAPAAIPSAVQIVRSAVRSGVRSKTSPSLLSNHVRCEPKPQPEDPIPLMAYSYRDTEQHRALPRWQCRQCDETGSDPPPRTCTRCGGPFIMVDRDRERRTA